MKHCYTHKVLIGRIHLVLSINDALKLVYITAVLFFERTTQASLIVNSISATKVATQIFLNKRMQKIENNAYIQIFLHCSNCIWDSRKHFGYPVDTETKKRMC